MTDTEINFTKGLVQKQNYKEYQINVDLQYGMQFSDKDSSYQVMVRWADEEIIFKSKSINQGLYKWYERSDKRISFPFRNEEEVPDIFIYLIKNNIKISYKRFKYSKLLVKDNYLKTAQLICLNPDKAMKNTRLDLAGYLRMKILVGTVEMFKNIKY